MMATGDGGVPRERFLVTGALGCIGAWTVRTLIAEGVPAVGFDLARDPHRLRLIATPAELARATLVSGDITDLTALERALDEHEITNVVHLAALQIPFCRADPPLGAAVNVAGTVNVFEAVKRRHDRIRTVVYASSAAVWSPAGRLEPETHYGVYKLANEGTARIYWQEDGVPSIGLRPYVVYGPGRDQGLTSAPTLAMAAAARGESFRIAFGGRAQYHYAPDVARALLAASRASVEGAHALDLGGPAVHMSEVVAAIGAAAPEAAGRIAFDDVPLGVPAELDGGPLELLFGPLGATPLAAGVRETVERFSRPPAAV